MNMSSRGELAVLRQRLVELAELVHAAIRDATAAFNKADAALADTALATYRSIVSLFDELDEFATQVPTKQELSPQEMQALLCYARAGLRLSRMGDFTRHIADIARRHAPDHVAPETLQASFVQMAAQTVDAAEQVARLVRGETADLVDTLVENDHWTDVLQRAAFAAVEAPGWAGGPERAVYVILVARYLERFGDHAVFIAEKVSALAANGSLDGPPHASR